jgi:hypothetical protein
VKTDVSRLLSVLIDSIVAFQKFDELVTIIESLLWVMEPKFLQAANDSGVESMPNSVQTLPAIEAGLLLGSSGHLFSRQATLPRRAVKARPLRVSLGDSRELVSVATPAK